MSISFLRRFLPATFCSTILLQLFVPHFLCAAEPDTSYQYHITLTRSLPDYLHEVLAPIHPKIGLVLSGGGARGLAQIGVLKALEQNHIPLRCIVGTSIGALVGGLYASGYTADELDSIARTSDWDDILAFGEESSRRELSYNQKLEYDRSLLTLQLDGLTPVLPEAASQGKRLSAFINKLTWNALYHAWNSFDDLKYSFRAVTTDLVSGTLIVFDHGSLADVIRASATAPLRFTPLTRDSLILVDGGLLSNIPVDVAKQCGCDIVIVVNTTSSLHDRSDLSTPFNVADQVVTIMMREQYAAQLAQANIVITPQLGEHGATDFTGVDGLIAEGEASTQRSIPAIHDTIKHQPTFSAIDPPGNGNIQHIVVTGLESEYKDTITSILQPLAGKPYTAETCLPIFERILRFFRQHGLSFATIASTQFELQTGTLTVKIEEGTLRSITVEGNTRTNESVILRELALSTGTPFRTDDAQRSLANLNGTDLFGQTTLEAIPTSDGVDLRIHVTEKSQPVLRLIGKADNEYNTQVGMQIANDNLMGRGVELAGLVYAGLRNNTEELTLASRRVLTTYLSYDLTLYNRQRNVLMYIPVQTTASNVDVLETGEYSEDRIGGQFSFGENVPQFGLVSVVARYEQQRMTSLSGAGLSGSDRVASLSGQLRLDTQDKFPFPRSGNVLNASYETALRILNANVAFTKVSFSYDAYFTYNTTSTFHPRIMWGYDDQTTPTMEQFRLGGQESFFGLREDQYLGNQVFAAGLEYRYMLPFRIYFDAYVKVRYDIGAVWPQISTIQFGDLRHGIGVSLAFDTPLGKADFAIGRSFVFANPIAGRPFAEAMPVFFYFTIGRGL